MSIAGLWTILSSYRPNAARQRGNGNGNAPAKSFGVFQARYLPPRYGVIRPRNDRDAQALYNHIRTVAFWMDASPLLSDLGLPFRAGIDDIISLVPLYGDVASGILALYQVWLSFIFGVPLQIIGWMILNVLLDTIAGIIPVLGDILDNLFKSNLRNLALLENWLLNDPSAQRHHVLLMPESDEFIPSPGSKWRGWFAKDKDVGKEEAEARERERRGGRVRKTRRIGRAEGAPVGVSVGVSQEGLD